MWKCYNFFTIQISEVLVSRQIIQDGTTTYGVRESHQMVGFKVCQNQIYIAFSVTSAIRGGLWEKRI